MTRLWERRALLRSGAAAFGGLAGCIGGQRDDPETRTSTGTTRETTRASPASATSTEATTTERSTTRTTETPAVELVPTNVQSSFFYRPTPGTLDVAAVEGCQFAFVDVRPLTDSPPPSDFTLVADDRHFWGLLAPGDVGSPRRLVEQGPGYRYDEGKSGWVAFQVPDPLDAEDVFLTHDGRRRPVGEDFLAALRAPPPDFELLTFDVPDRVSPDESFEASVVAKNDGEGSGTFRASLHLAGASSTPRRAEFAIPAGERREWTQTFGASVSAALDGVDVRFASSVTDRTATVDVKSETTTAGT